MEEAVRGVVDGGPEGWGVEDLRREKLLHGGNRPVASMQPAMSPNPETKIRPTGQVSPRCALYL